ncbi:hypothetical protein KBD61_01790 [Patescibacteria group bacterium]|nr:hypothetical protein [Patescibacteria group bacterium]MBP9709742.1 hypothetical protein [Patescibacteria group bacterium]
MNKTIGLNDLKENINHYEKLVKKGQSFIVLKRSKPIFTIGPIHEDDWETVIDFTKLRKNGISAHTVLKALKKT